MYTFIRVAVKGGSACLERLARSHLSSQLVNFAQLIDRTIPATIGEFSERIEDEKDCMARAE